MLTVNEKLSGKETSTIHRFERAGLGLAPFRFTGMSENAIRYPDGTSKAGGSCDFCGTGIRYEFWCVSADDKSFKVGCDCIHKSGDAGLVKQISIEERKLRDAKNKAAKVRKADKLAIRVEAAKAKLPSVRGTLSDQKHPNQHMADKGLTLLDYVGWLLENGNSFKGGSTGNAEKACFIIERAS